MGTGSEINWAGWKSPFFFLYVLLWVIWVFWASILLTIKWEKNIISILTLLWRFNDCMWNSHLGTENTWWTQASVYIQFSGEPSLSQILIQLINYYSHDDCSERGVIKVNKKISSHWRLVGSITEKAHMMVMPCFPVCVCVCVCV